MEIKVGQMLASATDSTAVIVVRTATNDVALTCGGAPMVDPKSELAHQGPQSSSGAGTQLGKRYADEELGLELLCTKAGQGSLAANGAVLKIKAAKPLPASD
jgi:hypothetical protein